MPSRQPSAKRTRHSGSKWMIGKKKKKKRKKEQEGNHLDRHTLGCIKYNPGADLYVGSV